ncbi:Uncharacterised protein [Mycobacterium tuberculosis]|nr:Uncharacterised protein [Mycobacterium tuberculosis]
MSADIIIGCTISTGGPTGGCPGRLSGGKYRRSLYIGTLSTIWDGDGTLPVSRPPSRRTSRPFCAVATRRSIGRVTIEKLRSTTAPEGSLTSLNCRAPPRTTPARIVTRLALTACTSWHIHTVLFRSVRSRRRQDTGT